MTTDQYTGGTTVVETPHEEPPTTEGGDGGHVHLPPQSLWPITMAFGITLAASGFVLNWFVSIPGLFLFVWALYGWARELMHDAH